MKLCTVDIHNHLLPGVDDGFKEADDSFAALKRLSDTGMQYVFFTPHLNLEVYPGCNEEVLRGVYSRFASKIPRELGLKTSLAAEYMINPGFEEHVAENKDNLLCYPDKSILVEMSYYFRSQNLENAIFQLQLAGYNPILAHPERYLYMVDSLEDFDMLRERGVRFQLNYLSFTGAYGSDSVKIIRYLAKKGYCDFISSDLHSLDQLDVIMDSKPLFFLRKQFAAVIP